jgi:PAS domain S-box-containing protein
MSSAVPQAVSGRPAVLVVDDNEQKRYSIARYLRAAGFEIWETSSGEEALSLALKEPAVIALDINLPDILGFEVSRRLRSNPKTASIPIIQISATFTTPNSKAQGLDSGADTYLTGPIEPEELVATVNAMIRMRKAEAIAREFAMRWQSTFDAIGDAVILLNGDGIIERSNRAFCELIRKPPEQVVGHALSDVAGPGALDQSVYFRMLGSRRRETIERQVENEWFNIAADPVVDPEGQLRGGVLIISNITDRKRAEEARAREQELLQMEAERLEGKVRERTQELEESVRSLEGFCYTIAHDLRAPLRAVNGLTSELLDQYGSCFDADGKHLGSRITAAARRMDRLIDELLAFGRLSNQDLPRRSVDLGAAFKAAVAQHTEEIEQKGATIDLDSALPAVWANPTIVEQIAANLVGNAIKFVPLGTVPKVKIEAEERGDFVRVRVKDNGIGIEPAYHKKIFGLFERLHSDKSYRGTGIGLAIVQKGVERMGGHAGVESEAGKGSVFWIELPKRERQAE